MPNRQILLAGEIQPNEKTGGGRVLKTHLDRLNDTHVVRVTPELVNIELKSRLLLRIIRRLKRTRFHQHATALEWLYLLKVKPKILSYSLSQKTIDCILVVAHGHLAFLTASIAHKRGIKIVVV